MTIKKIKLWRYESIVLTNRIAGKRLNIKKIIEGMNGITDVHIVWRRSPPYKNVRVGYSIHTFIKRPKSTFY